MKEKLLENKKKVLENLYLTVFAVFCLYFFMWTTTFWVSWPDFFVSDLRTIMIALIVVKASVSEKKSNWKELVFEIGLIVVFLAVKNRNGQEILLDTLLLILGAKEIASEKLIRVYTVTIATALFVTIGASLLGIIENLSYAQPGRMTRMAFGIGYPTDFGAHVLFLLLCYFYLRRKKIQYVELVITVLIGGLIYIFCGARTNALCIWLLAGVLFFTKNRRDDAKKRKKEYEMASWFSGLLASAGTICAAGILILSMLYTKGSSIFLKLDSILSQRLSFSQKGMEVYGFSIFGQYIPMQGNGGSTETPLNYFFLDSSYISILLQYGLIMFVMILILWGIIGLRARKEKDWVLLWILAIIAFQSIMEQHLLDISYNPFLWILFAETGKKRKQKKISGAEKNI